MLLPPPQLPLPQLPRLRGGARRGLEGAAGEVQLVQQLQHLRARQAGSHITASRVWQVAGSRSGVGCAHLRWEHP